MAALSCPPSSPRLLGLDDFGGVLHDFIEHAEQFRRYTELKEDMDRIRRGLDTLKEPSPALKTAEELIHDEPEPGELELEIQETNKPKTETPISTYKKNKLPDMKSLENFVVCGVCWNVPNLESIFDECDTVFHCQDGQVAAPSLLLAIISPWLGDVLQAAREGDRIILCPDITAKSLTGFLNDVSTMQEEIIISEDIKSLLLSNLPLKKIETSHNKLKIVKQEITQSKGDSLIEKKKENIDYNALYISKFENSCTCKITFPNIHQKIEHLKVVHDVYEKCHKCKKLYLDLEGELHTCKISSPAKQNKKSIKNKDKYMCTLCGKTSHNADYHSTIQFTCKECGKTVRDESTARSLHRYRCNKTKMPCPVCGIFVKHLGAHTRICHSSDKKFNCEYCEKGFTNVLKLKTHTNIHLNLKQHKCREGCDIGFNDPGNRNQHEKRVHCKE